MVAAQCPACARGVVVGDAPLDAETWRAAIEPSRARLAFWRQVAGGAYSVDELREVLKDAPMEAGGDAGPPTMRAVFGEEHAVYAWLAGNLYRHDPDMLGMLLDDFPTVVAGYQMEALLPAIRCPVLLLQADPAAGGSMTDAEVTRALPLLAHGRHVLLAGLSHLLFAEQKEPVLQAMEEFLGPLR
jgi:pimeloyl-ACP methyl ester carboxylesterase